MTKNVVIDSVQSKFRLIEIQFQINRTRRTSSYVIPSLDAEIPNCVELLRVVFISLVLLSVRSI